MSPLSEMERHDYPILVDIGGYWWIVVDNGGYWWILVDSGG